MQYESFETNPLINMPGSFFISGEPTKRPDGNWNRDLLKQIKKKIFLISHVVEIYCRQILSSNMKINIVPSIVVHVQIDFDQVYPV